MARDNTKAILNLHTQLARVMADGRFTDGRRKGAELRAFIIAYHWARFEGGDRDTLWERTKEQRQQPPAPTPVPNTGGLLPCYIRASNWPDIYTDASHGWKPPPVGLAADDWPVLVKVHVKAQQARRGFTVVPGGQQTTNDDDRPPPALRLVGD